MAFKSKERAREYAREHYLLNADRLRKKQREWRSRNPDRARLKPMSLHCAGCGGEFKAEKSKAKFCSIRCCGVAASRAKKESWISGSPVSNQWLRKELANTRGEKCEQCRLGEWLGSKIALEVDHINGNGQDSRPDNVRLLCPNCHSQTPTYKAKNRGHGRWSRRARYRAGKSY